MDAVKSAGQNLMKPVARAFRILFLFVGIIVTISYGVRLFFTPTTLSPKEAFPAQNVVILHDMMSHLGNRSWSGDGTTFRVWQIKRGDNKEIDLETIRDYRAWRSMDTNSQGISEMLTFFSLRPKYLDMEPFVKAILNEKSSVYLCEHYHREKKTITDAGLWLYSPTSRTLVYLDSKI